MFVPDKAGHWIWLYFESLLFLFQTDDRDRRSEDRKTDDSVERDKRPEDKRPEEKKSEIDTNVKSSPKQDPVTQHVAPEKPDPVPHTSPVGLKPDRRSSGPKPRGNVKNKYFLFTLWSYFLICDLIFCLIRFSKSILGLQYSVQEVTCSCSIWFFLLDSYRYKTL